MHNQLFTYRNIIKRKPPVLLFHYTSPIGLVGIAKSEKIWATDIKFLNDKKEFQYSLDITHAIIDNFKKINSTHKAIGNGAYEFVEFLRTNLGKIWNPEVYVTSFTEKGDLLSQWRGYCPKGGFSLGFHYKFLSQFADANKSVLVPCVYEERLQRKMLEELLILYSNKYINLIEGKKKKCSAELVNNISNEFILSLFAMAPMIKHSSFKEEKEWRIVFSSIIGESDIQFRPTESAVIPYIELPLCHGDKKIEFKKIFIGPPSNNQFSKQAILQLLGKFRVQDSAIQFSTTSYRC